MGAGGYGGCSSYGTVSATVHAYRAESVTGSLADDGKAACDEELASGAGYFSGEDLVGEGSPGVHQGAWSRVAVGLGGIVSVAEELLDGVVCPFSGVEGGIDLEVVHSMEELGWGDLKRGGRGRMFWSVGSEWRASIANWRSWPLRGARSTSPCSCTSCGKAVFAFGEEGLYLRADGFCIGGRVGAFPLRSDVGHLTDRQAYDFGREILGGCDRLQKFDGSWPLRRSTALHEATEDVERSDVEVGDGAGAANCESQCQQYGSSRCDPRVVEGVEAVGRASQ